MVESTEITEGLETEEEFFDLGKEVVIRSL